ncbi:MAG: Fe-S cluster assembly ATPase SufC [Chloroflexi bacterium]|nr:Fe-S cluster assembly ATPase SufC [Chloroflexota bacterium]MCH8309676.1 Fe-S cluster assembly ATPase SufC [Chloroflexota bacterium]
MLEIKDLHVSIDDNEILKGINLTVKAGEVHAIMGPNGSGKSTLANVIVGRPGYKVDSGEVIFEGRNILQMFPEDRARDGIFLAMQYPVELAGVRTWQFLKASVDAMRKHRGEEQFSVRQFDRLLDEKRKIMQIDEDLVRRSVNEGYSGGEKKRNEILQLLLLNPKLALLDETDSGLDIDALRIVSEGVNSFKTSENAIVLVTHYQRILNYITPDYVHVLLDGRIVRSGGKELAYELEDKGYDWLIEDVAATAS